MQRGRSYLFLLALGAGALPALAAAHRFFIAAAIFAFVAGDMGFRVFLMGASAFAFAGALGTTGTFAGALDTTGAFVPLTLAHLAF